MYRQFISCLMFPAALSIGIGNRDQAQAATVPPLPSEIHPTFPRIGPDHAVTYSARRGLETQDSNAITLKRHRQFVREETIVIGKTGDTRSISFSNLDTGASVRAGYASNKVLSAATFSKASNEDPWKDYSITRTEDSELIAGMRCTAWQAKSNKDAGPRYSACITDDGIVLRETTHFHDGSIMDEKRALTVEKREIARSEVMPDREALDWTFWAPPKMQAAVINGWSPGNYTLTLLEKSTPIAPRIKTYLSDDTSTSETDMIGNAYKFVRINGANASLTYSGRAPTMHIQRNARIPLPHASLGELSSPDPVKLIGEECRWHNMSKGISDYNRGECLTHDHLPLLISEGGRGNWRVEWEATSLSRKNVPKESILPPALLMKWTYWGWPELDSPR